MPHGYGFWTFGWKAGERLALFNERWRRLVAIQVEITESLLVPLGSTSFAQRDCEIFARLVNDLAERSDYIGSNLPDTTSAAFAGYAGPNDRANGNHLRSYATAIKNVVLKSAELCRKYRPLASLPKPDGGAVAVDKSEFAYDAQRKMITVDGNDLYFLGSGG